MKQLAAAFAIVSMIFLSACGGGSEKIGAVPTVPISFFSDLLIKLDETEMTAKLTVSPEASVLLFTSPDEVRGLKFHLSAGEYTMSFDGVEGAEDISGFSEISPAKALFNSLAAAVSDESLEVVVKNDTPELRGKSASGSFMLRINGTSGLPEYLSVPSLDLTAEFLSCETQ